MSASHQSAFTRPRRRITKSYNQRFIRTLKNTHNSTVHIEDQVIAPTYRDAISTYYRDGNWSYEHQTDGFFIDENLLFSMRLLLEAKYDLDLRAVHDRARVIIQCVYYMHRYRRAGHHQPTVIFGGDRDQMFAVYAPPLLKYLDQDHNWEVAPSEAWQANPKLMAALEADPSLTTFVYDIHDRSFDLNDVMETIDALAQNDGEYDRIRITGQNIRVVYDEFLRMISLTKQQTKFDTRDAVHLFIASIIGTNEVWIDPRVKNTLHLGDAVLRLDTIAYEAFFSRYEKTYTDAEIAVINSMYDTLIEETQRRFSGDYWTPTIWADEAHRMLDEALGQGWRSRYVVWDAACGTKNLTRDYTDFAELYTSTLFQQELDTSTMYNQEATAFQYDFLNDDIDIGPDARLFDDWKMPTGLFRALATDKPLVLLMNPPYGTATNDDETSKTGIAVNGINSVMKRMGLKGSSQQLYAQFFYRALKLKRDFGLSNVVLAYFSNERFLTGGGTWAAFMDDLQHDFQYHSGAFFNAGEFADVSARWGIGLTVWTTRGPDTPPPESYFPMRLAAAGLHGIKQLGESVKKSIHQDQFLSTWAKAPVKTARPPAQPDGTYARLSGPLKISGVRRGKLAEGALGFMHNNANDVEHSAKEVGIYSTAFGSGNGFSVMPSNFERAAITFAVRKSLFPGESTLWMTGHDNFLAPTSEVVADPQWETFVSDCAVLAISNRSGSNQSSMRAVDYEGTRVNVLNEWFWASTDFVRALAEKAGFRELSNDLKTYGANDRYMNNWLEERALTHRARAVIESLNHLLERTFPYRQQAHAELPGWHLNAWDAGFRQTYMLAQHASLQTPLDQYQEAFDRLESSIAEQASGYGLI